MARRSYPERIIDFGAIDDPMERGIVFLEALAYPGRDEAEAGLRFQGALQSYGVWAARKQYGLKALRDRGVRIPETESWEGAVRQGGLRIRRRLQCLKLWQRRSLWTEGDLSQLSESDLQIILTRPVSIRSVILGDVERWTAAFRLNRRASLDADIEDVIRRLSGIVKESRPVLHMAEQLRAATWRFAVSDKRPLPSHEKLSWRNAFFRAPEWIDDGIEKAEHFRIAQEPLRPNGLSAGELIELRL